MKQRSPYLISVEAILIAGPALAGVFLSQLHLNATTILLALVGVLLVLQIELVRLYEPVERFDPQVIHDTRVMALEWEKLREESVNHCSLTWVGRYADLKPSFLGWYFKAETDDLNERQEGYQLRRLVNLESIGRAESWLPEHVSSRADALKRKTYELKSTSLLGVDFGIADYRGANKPIHTRAVMAFLNAAGVPQVAIVLDTGLDHEGSDANRKAIDGLTELFEREWRIGRPVEPT